MATVLVPSNFVTFVGLNQYCIIDVIMSNIDLHSLFMVRMYISLSSGWRGMYVQFILLTLGM